MSTDDLVKIFREIGFPAAVAAFVLYRLEKALKEIVATLVEVRLALAALIRQAVRTTDALEDPNAPGRPRPLDPPR